MIKLKCPTDSNKFLLHISPPIYAQFYFVQPNVNQLISIWNENYINEEYIFVTLGDFIALHWYASKLIAGASVQGIFVEPGLLTV